MADMSDATIYEEPIRPGDHRFLPTVDPFCRDRHAIDRHAIDSRVFTCTRERGHAGDHAAHASGAEMVARWPREES